MNRVANVRGIVLVTAVKRLSCFIFFVGITFTSKKKHGQGFFK